MCTPSHRKPRTSLFLCTRKIKVTSFLKSDVESNMTLRPNGWFCRPKWTALVRGTSGNILMSRDPLQPIMLDYWNRVMTNESTEDFKEPHCPHRMNNVRLITLIFRNQGLYARKLSVQDRRQQCRSQGVSTSCAARAHTVVTGSYVVRRTSYLGGTVAELP